MKHRPVTIKDIAKALDISVATVSRALRDTYDVSQETREKVLQMAAHLKYKPNFNATGLVQRKTHTIGILLPAITNYYFSTVITGIQEVAYRNGFNIILFITGDSPERELEIVGDLSVNSLDGLLACISSPSDACAHFQEIIDNGLPVVFFDRAATSIQTSKVLQDDYNGAFEATVHLLQNGYRNIAHLAGPEVLTFTEARLRGYREALQQHGIAVDPGKIVYSGFAQVDGERAVNGLLNEGVVVDGIFAVNDRKAIGAMLALKKRGIQIGEEVGVIGFTGDPVCDLLAPTLSTIAEPAFEIGKRSCELLLKHIQKPSFSPEEVILPGKLIPGESSRRT
jgi:LacI family transcriptional regulator